MVACAYEGKARRPVVEAEAGVAAVCPRIAREGERGSSGVPR